MRQALAAGSATFLSFCSLLPTLSSRLPMPASLSPLILALSYLPMSVLSFPLMPALLSPPVPILLSLLMPVTLSRSVLDPAPTHLTSSALKIFKQALSDKLLSCHLTSLSLVGPLGPFLTLGPLPEKNDHKRSFETTFINSCQLAGNHAAKEMDLKFGECRCLTPVKLNQSW